MDPTVIKALLDALTASPPDPDAIAAAAKAVLAALAGAAGDGDSVPPPGEEASAEMAEPVPPKPGAAAPPGPPAKNPPPPAKNPPPPAAPPAKSSLAKAFGVKSDEDVIAAFRALQISVETLSADKNEAELDARRDMIAELVKLGVETPATAWEGKPEDRKPCKRLSAEPVSEMRTRIATLRASRPVLRVIEAPESTASDVAAEVARLSKNELRAIKDKNMTPEQFVTARATAARRIV